MGSRYTGTAIALHWVAAILILANLAFGVYLAGLPLSPAKLHYLPWHKWIGVTVLLLSAARLAWRLGHPAPALPASMGETEKHLARASHALLYVLFFASPLTGWLFSSAAGIRTVYLGLLPLPDLLGKDKAVADVLHIAHRWINYGLATLVVIHAAAALKHHFHDRDDVLRRMTFVAAFAFAAVLAPPVHAQQKLLAEGSFIRFALTQMGISVEGRFRKFDATIAFDPARPEATKGEFTVDLASIDLGTPETETEAKRKPWLDVQDFPQARFTAASVKASGGNRFEARGALTIKGVARDIVAPFTVTESNGVRTVDGQFVLKRLQYKVGEGEWADTDTVADDITVHFRFAISPR